MKDKQLIDVRKMQQIIASLIIDEAPAGVDTLHVKDMCLNCSRKYAPEHVTITSATDFGQCNLTVHFDKIDCTNMHYDEVSGRHVEYSYSPNVTLNVDSRTKSVSEMKAFTSACSEMLQLAEKIEDTLQRYVVVNEVDL